LKEIRVSRLDICSIVKAWNWKDTTV
jgi:hypothetical protein